MNTYSLTHLSDGALACGLFAAAAQDRTSTADLVAHIAEFDARSLYRPAGYSSMHLYCEHELYLSKDAVYKRIQVARAARDFPVIFEALADGRLHLTAVNLLAAHLVPENADELLAAAFHKRKSEIEDLIAERFPRTEPMPLIEVLPTSSPGCEKSVPAAPVKDLSCQLVPAQVGRPVRGSIAPLASRRFHVQFAMDQEMHDDLQCVQDLLGHQIPSGDLAKVFHRGIQALKRELEKRKFAATDRPRRCKARQATDSRYIPAEVRRAVAARDGRQCTFTSETGNRCQARKLLEFDHIQEVARGGQSTEANLRLRCRAHNQYAAEQTYGASLMKRSARKHAALGPRLARRRRQGSARRC